MFHHRVITRQLLRTFKTPIIQQKNITPLIQSTTIPLLCHTNNTSITNFSTNTKKSKKGKANNEVNGLYKQQKQEKQEGKQKRTNNYNKKMERQMKLKYRRMKPETIVKKNYLKNQFKSWFDKKRDWELIQDKLARKSGRFENVHDAWLIKVAIAVERLPLITPEPPDWEKDFIELKEHLDSFKIKYPEDSPFAVLNEPGKGPSDWLAARTERDLFARLTKDYELKPRITEDDKTNNIHSLNRKLHTRLFLTTPETITDDSNKSQNVYNILPTTTVQKDETLIQACRRAVSEKVGTDLILYTPSNCPMAVNIYLHDHDVSEYWGEKIFVFRCHRDIGDVDENIISKDDYAWLDKEEVVDKVKNATHEYASKFYHYLL